MKGEERSMAAKYLLIYLSIQIRSPSSSQLLVWMHQTGMGPCEGLQPLYDEGSRWAGEQVQEFWRPTYTELRVLVSAGGGP